MSTSLKHANKPPTEHAERKQTEPGFKVLRRRALAGAVAAAVAVLILSCTGCQSPAKIPKQLTGTEPGALAPGDVVKLTYPGSPDLNQTQKIRADGKVSLPLIGEIVAAGKRLGEFQDEVDVRYKPLLKSNAVVVSLDASSVPVYVTGAVGRPGKVILERPMTVLEAIMEAGGTSNLGTLKGVVVIRNSKGRHFTQTFDLSPALKGHQVDAFYLKAYDMVYVPERFF